MGKHKTIVSSYAASATLILTYFLPRLADSVQYDEETEKAYFAMPLTEKMTVDELFRKIGSFASNAPK
jgi:hypothetical protein